MSQSPSVSVVTCFLNAGQFLRETIESVRAQTLSSWELLLVDDGSQDESTGIARRYVAEYPDRIRCFEHDGHGNLGSSASRNVAIRHARGEYMAILDADDVLLPHALERRVKVLRERPEIGFLYGPALRWWSWTGAVEDQRRDRMENLHLAADTVFPPPSFCAYLLDYDAAIPSPCTVLIRRDAVEAVGGFEDSFHDLFDDQAFYIKLSLRTAACASGECDSRYRQHADSTCAIANRSGRTDAARLVYLDWVGRYLRDCGVADQRVWAAFRLLHRRFNHPRWFQLSQSARGVVKKLGALAR